MKPATSARRTPSLAPSVLLPASLLAVYGALLALFPFLRADGPAFLAYMGFFILLPGYALGRHLVPLRLPIVERVALGYPVALCLLFLLFWIAGLTGLRHLPLLLPGLSLYSLWLLWRKRGELNQQADSGDHWLMLALALAGLALCARFLFDEVPPTALRNMYIDKDFGDISGLAYSMSRFFEGHGYQDPRMAGVPMAYHVLQLIFFSYAERLFGIFPYYSATYLAPVFEWFLLAGALVTGCRRLAGMTRMETALFAILLLFTTGISTYYYAFQLYWALFSFFFCLPPLILFLTGLTGFYTGRQPSPFPLYLPLVFLAAGGSKGPLVPLFVLAYAGVCLVRLIQRRLTRGEFLMGLGMVAAVAVLKLTMFAPRLVHITQTYSIAGGIGKALVDWRELLFCPEVFFLGWLYCTDRIFRIRAVRWRPVILFCLFFILAASLFPYLGISAAPLYYRWLSWLPVLFLLAPAMAYALEKRRKAAMIAVALILCLGVGRLAWNYSKLRVSQTLPEVCYTLSPDEWDALAWARANIPHENVFITNRMAGVPIRSLEDILDKSYPCHYYSGFSGMLRYTGKTERIPEDLIAERDQRMLKVFAFFDAKSPEEAELRLRDIPAQYFIHNKTFDALKWDGQPGLVKVYDNPSMAIYRIQVAHE